MTVAEQEVASVGVPVAAEGSESFVEEALIPSQREIRWVLCLKGRVLQRILRLMKTKYSKAVAEVGSEGSFVAAELQ